MEKYLERIESLKNSRSADELRLNAKKYGLILSEKEDRKNVGRERVF